MPFISFTAVVYYLNICYAQIYGTFVSIPMFDQIFNTGCFYNKV